MTPTDKRSDHASDSAAQPQEQSRIVIEGRCVHGVLASDACAECGETDAATPCTCTIACIPQGITEEQTCRLHLENERDAADVHPCPKGDDCALNKGAVHCFACRRDWPRDASAANPQDDIIRVPRTVSCSECGGDGCWWCSQSGVEDVEDMSYKEVRR